MTTSLGPVVDPPEMKMPPFLQTALGFPQIAYWNDLAIFSDVGLANPTVEGKSMWAAVAPLDPISLHLGVSLHGSALSC